MLKWLQSIDWLAINSTAFVLVVSLWIGSSTFGLSPNDRNYSNPGQHHPANTSKDESTLFDWVERNHDAVEAISAAGVFAFTIALVGTSWLLWQVTRRQVRISERAFLETERALISMQTIHWIYQRDPFTKNVSYVFRPIWSNSGRTPTKNMRTNTLAELRPSALDSNFPFTRLGSVVPPALVGPQSSITGGSEKNFSAQNLKDIRDGKQFLYLWGWATYHDVFDDTPLHVTRYCSQVVVLGDPDNPEHGQSMFAVNFLQHTRGNCIDGECEAQGLPCP